jgi:hypothetical protein
MIRRTLLLILFLFCSATASAEEDATFESLWNEANANPNHSVSETAGAIRVLIPGEITLYDFSKPGTPAHPGVVRWSLATTTAKMPAKRLVGTSDQTTIGTRSRIGWKQSRRRTPNCFDG